MQKKITACAAVAVWCVGSLASVSAVGVAGVLVAGRAEGQAAGGVDYERIAGKHAAPLVEQAISPSVVVGISHAGRVTYHAFGVMSEGDPRPVDERTIYEIGSVTKTMTAILLAEADRRGELSIDDALSDRLPEGVAGPTFGGEGPTLGQMADHTSGFPRLPANLAIRDPSDPYAGYTRARLMSGVDGLVLERRPGASYAYSNFAPGLLGELLVDAAGAAGYEALLGSRLTGPLGMVDTSVTVKPGDAERLAPAHLADGSVTPHWDLASLAGAGGVRSTAADLVVYGRAQLAARSGDAEGLSAAILRTHTRRAAVPGGAIALGWHIARDGDTIWHNGMTGGSASAVFVSPALDLVVVVLANAASDRLAAVAERVVQEIAGVPVEPVVTAPKEDGGAIARLEGRYTSPLLGGAEFVVTRRGSRLVARLGPQQAFEVFSKSPTRFEYREIEAELEFELPDGEGPAVAVTLFQSGQEIRMERVGFGG